MPVAVATTAVKVFRSVRSCLLKPQDGAVKQANLLATHVIVQGITVKSEQLLWRCYASSLLQVFFYAPHSELVQLALQNQLVLVAIHVGENVEASRWCALASASIFPVCCVHHTRLAASIRN